MDQQDLPRRSLKKLPITEKDYFVNDAEKLRYIRCPNCNEVECLFKGFFYIGCRECGNFFKVTTEGYLV